MHSDEESETGAPPSAAVYEKTPAHWRAYGQIPSSVIGKSVDELAYCLNAMEISLNQGQHVNVQLNTDTKPTDEELTTMYNSMVALGFHTTKPIAKQVGGIASTEFVLRKGSPQWALLIALIPTALVIGLITFGITRIESISKAILPITLVAIGGAVLIVGLATRKHVIELAGPVAQRALRGG